LEKESININEREKMIVYLLKEDDNVIVG
jgi:hypothetical protein